MSDISVALSNGSYMPTIHPCMPTVDKVYDTVISCFSAFVCLCVRALKGKRLEPSTPKSVQNRRSPWQPVAVLRKSRKKVEGQVTKLF